MSNVFIFKQALHCLFFFLHHSSNGDFADGGYLDPDDGLCHSCDKSFAIGSDSPCRSCNATDGCTDCTSNLFADVSARVCISRTTCFSATYDGIDFWYDGKGICLPCDSLYGTNDPSPLNKVGSCSSGVGAVSCSAGILMGFKDAYDAYQKHPHDTHNRRLLGDSSGPTGTHRHLLGDNTDQQAWQLGVTSQMWFCTPADWCDTTAGYYIQGSGDTAKCRKCPDYCPGTTCTGPYLVSVGYGSGCLITSPELNTFLLHHLHAAGAFLTYI